MNANSPELWDAIWREEGLESWRQDALKNVYARIAELLPAGEPVFDLGGGVGQLARVLIDRKSVAPEAITVVDHSPVALNRASQLGCRVLCIDLEENRRFVVHDLLRRPGVFAATEVLEHLSVGARNNILENVGPRPAFFSVPNNRLGPDEESQHTIQWTALEFLTLLRRYYNGASCRVECIDGYLLGICGERDPRTWISVTFPARDEEVDIERTLKSFRGIADQIVVGIDPRSVDRTRQIAEQYAETVFTLDSPTGPSTDRVADKGVHFAHIRNQCIERCVSPWIFMTEAHESLASGQDLLLRLDEVLPKEAQVAFVLRRLGDQQWGFPWLFRNRPGIEFRRSTHNILYYPDGTYCVKLPQVTTLHDRAKDRAAARHEQRKVQNRKSLLDDWLTRGSGLSLYYLSSEWRDFDPRKTREYLEEFVRLERRGPHRYQAKLALAMEYAKASDYKATRAILVDAAADDWSRTEHWLWLGDLAHQRGQFEEAYQFYRYAAVGCGRAPFTTWWIDLPTYSYLPAQRLASTCADLGQYREALEWAMKAEKFLPEDAPAELRAEAKSIVDTIAEYLDKVVES